VHRCLLHILSASLLVPVKMDRCLFFVTDVGIVCLDRLPFYWNDVTRSAHIHDYAGSQTNWWQGQPNRQHCRRFVRPWQKHWFLSKVAYTFDFVKSVYQALQRTLCTYVTNESGEIPGFVYDRQRRAWPQGLWQWWSTAWNGSTTEHRHCSSEKMTTACYLLQQLALQRCCHHLLLITNKVDVKLRWHWINCN